MANEQVFDYENWSEEPELIDWYYEIYDGVTDFFDSGYFTGEGM